MNKKELADLLGIKVRTLEKFIAAGRVPFIKLSQKVIRFHYDDVITTLRSQP
jgi:excisionase family DNA binding protein